MKISILSTDEKHPVMPVIKIWAEEAAEKGHTVFISYDISDLVGGDILFLVSCSQLVRDEDKRKFKTTLVLHASDLPRGRGWSPYIWAILQGKHEITVSLIEASEPVDSGDIWLKTTFNLEGHELLDEIHQKLFNAEAYLMTKVVDELANIVPEPQVGHPGEYMKKRSPSDSEIDPEKTLADQFELLRVVDSDRFPAFFDYREHRYLLRIEKDENEKR